MFKLLSYFILILLTLNITYSIKYFPADDTFEVFDFEYFYDENYIGNINFEINSKLSKSSRYYVEILSVEENLIVFQKEKNCKTSCKISGEFDKTFFGKYIVKITTDFEGRFYQKKIPFLLELEKAKYDVTFAPHYFLDANSGINVKGFISSNQVSPINYSFDIFPKTAYDNIKTFSKVCETSCEFNFLIDEKILIDEYLVNIYSPIGELQKRFLVKLPYLSNSLIQNNTNQSELFLKEEKFNNYFSESSSQNIKNYFINNLENKSYDVIVNLIDKFTQNLKSKSETSYGEILNLEFLFSNLSIQNIFIKNAKVSDLTLELTKLNYSDSKFNSTISSFEFLPNFNPEIFEYELTYKALGTNLLQCTKFNLLTKICDKNFVKILQTIPGEIYTISLPVQNSIFIELNNIQIENSNLSKTSNNSLISVKSFEQKTTQKPKSILIQNKIVTQDEILKLFNEQSLVFDKNENAYYTQKLDYNEILSQIELMKKNQNKISQLEITSIPNTVILGDEFEFEIEISKNDNLSNFNLPENTKLIKPGLITNTLNYFKEETEFVELSTTLNSISGEIEIKDLNGKLLDKKIVEVKKSEDTKTFENKLNVEVIGLEKLDENSNLDKKENIKLEKENTLIEFKNVTTSKIETIEIINKKNVDKNLSDENLATNILHVEANEFQTAQITLEKSEFVEEILTCKTYQNQKCISGWKPTNLKFSQNETHVFFNVTHFSAYVAKSSGYQFSITPVDQSQKSVGQNDEIQIDFLVSCDVGNCGTIDVDLLLETGFSNYEFFEIPGNNYNSQYACAENPTSGNDDSVYPYQLGFDFPFYSETILGSTNINLDTNGRLILGAGTSDYSPTTAEMDSQKMIAGTWTDLGNGAQNNEYTCLNKDDDGLKYSVFRHDSTWYNNAGSAQTELILYDNGNIQINHGTLVTKSGVFTGISAGDNLNNNYFQTDGSDYSSKSYIYYRNSGTQIPTTNTGQPFYTKSTQSQSISLTSGQNQVISFIINASGSIGTQTIFTRAKSQSSLGIRAQSIDIDVLIKDAAPPTATLITPINNYIGTGSEKTFNFDVNLQDDTQLNSATLYIWDNLNQIIYQNTSSVSGTNTNFNWDYTFSAAGDYKWNVLAEDTSFSTSWANNGNFSIQINVPTIELNYITSPGDINVTQTIPKKITLEVKCYSGDCGDINLSMLQQSSSSEYQNFETDFGTWVNVVGDDADWQRKSGPSGSSSTGPYYSGDSTSSPSGVTYVYTEASNPNFPSKTFLLEKSGLSLTNKFNVNFWYHMFGSNMGNLYFEVFDDGGWQTVWTKSGSQGQIWYNQNITYTPTTTVTAIRFNVLTGSGFRSDIAIDDISFSTLLNSPMPETTIGNKFSINSSYNHQILNMLDGETKNISFYIFENGNINDTSNFLFELTSVDLPFYNQKTSVSTMKISELLLPEINVQRIQPISNSSVAYKGGQFDLVYNVSCISTVDCNNINLSLEYTGLDSIGETGSLDLQNNEQKTITFKNKYSQTPVLLAVPVTDNDDDNNPLVPIIHSINSTTAIISLCEDAGLTTCSTDTELETINYYIFDINKSNIYPWIDVGYVNNKVSNGASSSFSFSKTFTNVPYVFGQSQTYGSASNQIGTHTWFPSKTTNSANLVACDHPGTGDVCAGTFTDNIGYVAIDVVLANLIGLDFGTQSISASTWTPISFTQSYTNPNILVAQNSETGAQDPQYPWAKDLTTTGSQIRYCEADGGNYCDSHNAETVIWMSLEDGFIQVNNTVTLDISTISDSVPVFIDAPQTNPNQLNLTAQTSQLVSFPLFFTGNFETPYEISDSNNYNVQTSPFNVSILYSDFTINISSPISGQGVIVNDTFQIKANLTCSGFCGEITISARENNTIITNLTSNKIYSVDENNLVCNPGIDGSCIVTWDVYTNDIVGNTYDLDVLFSSDILGDKDTQNVQVTIVGGPEVKFEDDTLDIIGVIANYQEQSLDTNIIPLIASQTNLSVNCISGDCNFITSNFTQDSDITLGTPLGIKFTCLPDAAGSYSALFNLTSFEDQIPNTINVSCSASELDLYVNLVNPEPKIRFDIEQNKTTTLDFNITCNIPGGCSNTQLGLHYLRNSIGEVGEIDLQNFEKLQISFQNTYDKVPVIFAIPASDNGADNNALIPVITEISKAGFTIQLCEDTGSATCDPNTELETVNYYVFDIDKTNSQSWIEVGYLNNINSNGGNNLISFNKTFTNNPYVFAQSQTVNRVENNMAPTTWAHSITTSQAQLIACDHPGIGDVCAGSTIENYAYLAIDVQNANIGELSYGSRSISNSAWSSVSFTENYQNPIMLVSQNSDTGSQDPQYPWAQNLAFNGAQVRYCEQDAIGVCHSHSAETVVWLAMQSGPIYLDTAANNLVSTTNGQTPYFTTSVNPQTLNLAQGSTTTVSYQINATGTIDQISFMYGLLHTGIGSKNLPIRTIGKNELLYDQTNLTFNQVYQDELPGVKSSNLFSRYNNINTNINCISGNCSTFSTSWINGNSLLEGQNQNIDFICDDSITGNFSATFNVLSNNSQITNQVNLYCNVKSKPLDIDFNNPKPNTQNNLIVYQTTNLEFNVTCKTTGGCNNIDVFAKFVDNTKIWWNSSWSYKHPITITSSTNAPLGYQLLIQLNETNVGPRFDWSNSCVDLRFIKSNSIELNYWIESCNLGTKTANIWIKSDEALTTGTPYNFEMYYLNPSAISNSNPNNVFRTNEIHLTAGDCAGSGVCDMDTDIEADTLRQNIGTPTMTVHGTGYVTLVNQVDNPYGVDDNYFTRYRFLYIPTISTSHTFGTRSDDDSQIVISQSDSYGNGLNGFGTYDVVTTQYGTWHQNAACGSTPATEGTRFFTSGTGYWMEYLHVEGTGGQDQQMCIDTGSGYQIFDTTNFPNQIFAREYVTAEPVVSIGTYDDRYTNIPSSNTGLGFWTQTINPQNINLLNDEIQTISFLINSSTPFDKHYKVLGVLSNGDTTSYTNLSIIDLPTTTNLSIDLDKTQIGDNLFNAKINFLNLANLDTPRFNSLYVYLVQSNQIQKTTNFVIPSSTKYVVTITNETLNNNKFNGTIHKFKLTPNPSLYTTVFSPYNLTYNSTNSFKIEFNYTQNKTNLNQMLYVGFDPQLEKIQIENKSSKSLFNRLIQIFINLVNWF